MKLTNKALEDFDLWFEDKYFNNMNFYYTKPTIFNALIVEWFDSVGIYVSINYCSISEGFECKVKAKNFNYCDGIHDRIEATTQAILTANKLYNEKRN